MTFNSIDLGCGANYNMMLYPDFSVLADADIYISKFMAYPAKITTHLFTT